MLRVRWASARSPVRSGCAIPGRTNDLWGRCKVCYYADVCRAGCSWTTTVLFGKPGNNPYCHHRVLELEKLGLRERVVKIEESIHLPLPAPAASTIRPPRGRAGRLPVLP